MRQQPNLLNMSSSGPLNSKLAKIYSWHLTKDLDLLLPGVVTFVVTRIMTRSRHIVVVTLDDRSHFNLMEFTTAFFSSVAFRGGGPRVLVGK